MKLPMRGSVIFLSNTVKLQLVSQGNILQLIKRKHQVNLPGTRQNSPILRGKGEDICDGVQSVHYYMSFLYVSLFISSRL